MNRAIVFIGERPRANGVLSQCEEFCLSLEREGWEVIRVANNEHLPRTSSYDREIIYAEPFLIKENRASVRVSKPCRTHTTRDGLTHSMKYVDYAFGKFNLIANYTDRGMSSDFLDLIGVENYRYESQ